MTNDELRVRQLLSENKHIWLPPPDLTVSQWADMERRIPPEASPEPGRWRTSRAEYQREIMDAVSDPHVERVVVMCASQVGKSELLLNIIGYYIDQEPSPILNLQPNEKPMGESFSKDRVAPMIRDTPALQGKVKDPRSRDSGNTILHKSFVGGHLTIAGANSPAGLASRPIRVLLCDEVDRYPSSAGTEGDPVTLAIQRTQNFWNRRIILVSTPTIKEISRIEKAYNNSSRESWCIPCPTCGEFQPYEWDRIIHKNVPEPLMKCRFCDVLHNETEWKAGQDRGIWIADDKNEKRIRGFHMNAFASPWVTWQNIVDQYQEAYQNGEESLQSWWNLKLGLPWENQGGAIEVEELESHREVYSADVPDAALVLTCGVDVQGDRIEAEIVGWGAGKESWGIYYRVFMGDPAKKMVWEALDEFLLHLWEYSDGEQIGLACVCIDSGGHHTDDVYRFCKARERRNVFAIKGSSVAGKPSISKPSRSNRRKVALFSLGVDTLKDSLFARLKTDNPGPGFCHFPKDLKRNHRGYDETYFKGLVSERMVIKKYRGRDRIEWVKRSASARNEPLDCRVYATAALEIFNPDLEKKRERRIIKRKKGNKRLKMPDYSEQKHEELPPQKETQSPEKVTTQGKQPVRRRPSGVRVIGSGFKF